MEVGLAPVATLAAVVAAEISAVAAEISAVVEVEVTSVVVEAEISNTPLNHPEIRDDSGS